MKGLLVLMLALLAWPPARAEIDAGVKRVALEADSGERVVIGTLELRRDGDGWRFAFTPNDEAFSDRFLSMRPFKCIDGSPMLCRLEYPYARGRRIGADFTDLEYEFLFIERSPAEYGIDPYNGRYYVLEERDGALIGEPRAVDLNLLASPPESGITRPIGEADLDRIEVGNERFQRLVIR